ncbi:MAG: SIR2 family protein [Acidimicrobiaceae bacterium]|nr:SIR2 family protein [Acidimicrobiaceae bacterium]
MTDNSQERELGVKTRDVLDSFDDKLASFASAVARQAEYVFWLGSGLSASVVPCVSELLIRLLTFLQERLDRSDEGCRFRKALDEIIEISGIPQETRNGIDLTAAVESWPDLDDIVQRLVSKYSKVLGVLVDNEEPDFLVWEGIDVVQTYGSSDLEPAAEHLCLAILLLEGTVRSVASANWDGLIESAVERLTGDTEGHLRVVILPEDFKKPEARCDLIKFHGCAVKAAEDQDAYRSRLIARQSQIYGWTTEPQHVVTRTRLEDWTATKKILMVGLSAQDSNIHTILNQARQNLSQDWPVDPPAVVFALESLDSDQQGVLNSIYGESYLLNHQEIEKTALLGAYAQPLLLGLVLFTLTDKLCSLIGELHQDWDTATLRTLEDGLRNLRDSVASIIDDDATVFVDSLIATTGMALSMFRYGSPPCAGSRHYQPLTAQPIAKAVLDPNIDIDELGFLAVAVSLLGMGAAQGLWRLTAGDAHQPDNGVCTVESAHESRVFFVRDSGVLSRLEKNGHVNMTDPSVVVVHAKEIPEQQVRSPRVRYGRTGRYPAREVAIETVAGASTDANGLLTSFRQSADL